MTALGGHLSAAATATVIYTSMDIIVLKLMPSAIHRSKYGNSSFSLRTIDLTTIDLNMKSNINRLIRNSNWKSIPPSSFQVLTANLATLLDLYGVEKGLDHYRSTPTLSFQHFRFYLAQEVFSATTSLAAGPSVTLSQLRDYEEKIDEVSGNTLF